MRPPPEAGLVRTDLASAFPLAAVVRGLGRPSVRCRVPRARPAGATGEVATCRIRDPRAPRLWDVDVSGRRGEREIRVG